jgi:3',5'-cyclic AMP phosphodiesterase CpdA
LPLGRGSLQCHRSDKRLHARGYYELQTVGRVERVVTTAAVKSDRASPQHEGHGLITPFGELPNKLAVDMSMAEQHEWLERPVSRRAVLAAILGTAITPLLWTQTATASAAAAGVGGRHLAFGPDPRTQMIVGFSSGAPISRADVIATSVREDHSVTAPATLQTVRGSTARYARSTLSGLRPDTAYHYDIRVDGQRVSSSTFTTAAESGPFRFTAFGDQGVGPRAVGVLTTLQQLTPRFHLLAGDLCYADSSGQGGPGDTFDPTQWDYWLAQNDPLGSHLPWMIAPGNHEMEPGFANHGYAGFLSRVAIGGTSPLAVPVASTFRYSCIGFVGLDSNDVSYEIPANRGWTQGQQTSWLDSTLAALRADPTIDFIVAYMHASPYSTSDAHGCEGGIRESWVPLFDKYQVDLVISGHNHCYERTLPLRQDAITAHTAQSIDSELGTTYITAGGGGQVLAPGFYPAGLTRVSTLHDNDLEAAPWAASERAQYGALCADVVPSTTHDAPTLHLRAYNTGGLVVDEVTLTRSTKRRPAPPSDNTPAIVGGASALAIAGAGAIGIAAMHRARQNTSLNGPRDSGPRHSAS